MKELEGIVGHYLGLNTNYALTISGKWGVGKTYYFNNTLKEFISKIPTCADARKKYKPLLISLFGLNSIEDIQTAILLSLYPFMKKKGLRLGMGIGKSLIKAILRFEKLDGVTDFFSDIEVKKSDLINLEDLVLCFDDLERLSKSLNMKEFIGYVNGLVENENIKVLLISNESEIEDEDYLILKEKVVGNSIEFIQDMNSSFDSLVIAKFGSSLVYNEFLEENKDFIIKIFSNRSSNLRILSFALSYFQRIFSVFINETKTHELFKEKKEEVLKMLLKFSIGISIEYKEGNITYTKKNKLDQPMDLAKIVFRDLKDDKELLSLEENENDTLFRDQFIFQYYDSREVYHFFQSIYDFITGGAIIKQSELIQELIDFYHVVEDVVVPQYDIFTKLNYGHVFALSNRDYKTLTREMLRYADKGGYELKDYVTIFHFASRFNNPLQYDMDKLARRIIKGMRQGQAHFKYSPSLDMHLQVDVGSENEELLRTIRSEALSLNEEVLRNSVVDKNLDLERLCYEDFPAFFKEVLDRKGEYWCSPIFRDFNPHKFYLFFLRADNDLRWEIVGFWKSRYSNTIMDLLKSDLRFLREIRRKIGKKILSLPKSGINTFVFTEFEKELEIIINKFEE